MGIKNLSSWLNDLNLRKKINNTFENKTKVAIDISIMIYQVVISIRNSGADLTNKRGEITSHILGIFNKTIKLMKNNIIPIYVFDGKPPNLKKNILSERRDIRNRAMEKLKNEHLSEKDRIKYLKKSVHITKQQIEDCKELFNLMGVPYIQAPEEADSQCAYLVKKGLVEGVLTEDMDILTFGASKIYNNLASFSKNSYVINLNDILEKLNITNDEFIKLCMLFGCDYLEGLRDIKPKIIYEKFIENNKSFDDTINAFNSNNKFLNYEEVYNYFISDSSSIEVNKDNINLKKINKDLLIDKLVNDYSLIKRKILYKIDFLEEFKKL